MNPSDFVDSLCAYQSAHVFNPYVDVCPLHDRPDAAKIRRSNLLKMIGAAQQVSGGTIWVARDLGYRGGRRTGLALTDDGHLKHAATMLRIDGLEQATHGPVTSERTATVIWDALLRIQQPVMLWNVFPFHPHEPGDQMTNRCHTKSERKAALPFLHNLLKMLNPTRIIAIGRDAAAALEKSSIAVHQARHPSYGGQAEFTRQIECLYDLKPVQAEQRNLNLLLPA